jgi:nucleotide-binding universal stress UspA family protein
LKFNLGVCVQLEAAMSIQRILVPVTEFDNFKPLAATAILVARQFRGHAQFLYQRDGDSAHRLLRSFGSLNMSQFSHLLESHREKITNRARKIREDIEALIKPRGVSYVEKPSPSTRPSVSCCEIDEPIAELVEHVGGVSDLVVVGQPSEAHDDPEKTVIGRALFATGRPVLMAPSWVPETLDGKVLIGWNRSIQAGRSVTSALPFLQRARSVKVINVATDAKQGPSAQDLADYLTWHGIEPEVNEIPHEEHRAVGDILLEEVKTSGADLLVMGAYSHSRLRELLWGGVTKHIVSHARTPVLMAR